MVAEVAMAMAEAASMMVVVAVVTIPARISRGWPCARARGAPSFKRLSRARRRPSCGSQNCS